MSEYIKREDAEKILFDILYKEPPYINSEAGIKRWVNEQLADVPSIDIVKCQECKYWHDAEDGYVESPICERDCNVIEFNPDDFCSYGERKEN